MSTDLVFLALLMGAVTYPWRAIPMLAPGFDRLPALAIDYLRLVGPAVLAALATRGVLAPDARVYVEHRAREPLPELPAGWHSVRDGRAGEVGYHLLAT